MNSDLYKAGTQTTMMCEKVSSLMFQNIETIHFCTYPINWLVLGKVVSQRLTLSPADV